MNLSKIFIFLFVLSILGGQGSSNSSKTDEEKEKIQKTFGTRILDFYLTKSIIKLSSLLVLKMLGFDFGGKIIMAFPISFKKNNVVLLKGYFRRQSPSIGDKFDQMNFDLDQNHENPDQKIDKDLWNEGLFLAFIAFLKIAYFLTAPFYNGKIIVKMLLDHDNDLLILFFTGKVENDSKHIQELESILKEASGFGVLNQTEFEIPKVLLNSSFPATILTSHPILPRENPKTREIQS